MDASFLKLCMVPPRGYGCTTEFFVFLLSTYIFLLQSLMFSMSVFKKLPTACR